MNFYRPSFNLNNFINFWIFFSGPLGMPDVDTTDGSTISRASALDVQADQIVQRLEKDKELMEDKPKSEKDRMYAIQLFNLYTFL